MHKILCAREMSDARTLGRSDTTLGRSDARTLGCLDVRTHGRPSVQTPGHLDTHPPLFSILVAAAAGSLPARGPDCRCTRAGRSPRAAASAVTKIAKNCRGKVCKITNSEINDIPARNSAIFFFQTLHRDPFFRAISRRPYFFRGI